MAVDKISCLVAVVCMVVVVVVAPYAAEAITCGQVQGKLVPCLGYLRNGGAVPGQCCNGVRSLNGMARTTADRQQACRCLQSAAVSIAGIKAPFAADLPSKCGVIIPYKISRSTDCSKSVYTWQGVGSKIVVSTISSATRTASGAQTRSEMTILSLICKG